MAGVSDTPVGVREVFFVEETRDAIGAGFLPGEEFVRQRADQVDSGQFRQFQCGKKLLGDEERAPVVTSLASIFPGPFGEALADDAIGIGQDFGALHLQLNESKLDMGIVSRADHALVARVEAVVGPPIVTGAAVAAGMVLKPPVLFVDAVEFRWRRSSGDILVDLPLGSDHLVIEPVAPANLVTGRLAEAGMAFFRDEHERLKIALGEGEPLSEIPRIMPSAGRWPVTAIGVEHAVVEVTGGMNSGNLAATALAIEEGQESTGKAVIDPVRDHERRGNLVVGLDLVAARRREVAEIRLPKCSPAGLHFDEFALIKKRAGLRDELAFEEIERAREALGEPLRLHALARHAKAILTQVKWNALRQMRMIRARAKGDDFR